ncbi:MAG: hypothetical protein CL932_15185 [Deltaproteobacteria bacterium]|nr:hypothetical protein [Deltaproteobacteria bacterium]
MGAFLTLEGVVLRQRSKSATQTIRSIVGSGVKTPGWCGRQVHRDKRSAAAVRGKFSAFLLFYRVGPTSSLGTPRSNLHLIDKADYSILHTNPPHMFRDIGVLDEEWTPSFKRIHSKTPCTFSFDRLSI